MHFIRSIQYAQEITMECKKHTKIRNDRIIAGKVMNFKQILHNSAVVATAEMHISEFNAVIKVEFGLKLLQSCISGVKDFIVFHFSQFHKAHTHTIHFSCIYTTYATHTTYNKIIIIIIIIYPRYTISYREKKYAKLKVLRIICKI